MKLDKQGQTERKGKREKKLETWKRGFHCPRLGDFGTFQCPTDE
jgi:hypothetical protein